MQLEVWCRGEIVWTKYTDAVGAARYINSMHLVNGLTLPNSPQQWDFLTIWFEGN